MAKFTLKTLLLMVGVGALIVALVMSRIELAEKNDRLNTLSDEMRYLNIADQDKINAIEIPGFGRKSWRWRIQLPAGQVFRLRLAFDEIPPDGLPIKAPDLMMCELPAGESILTASLINENGQWGINLYSEIDGQQNFDFVADANGTNTDWLAKRGGCSEYVAGSSSTVDGPSGEPFILLSYRDGLSPRPGVTATNPNPTDGVLIWIQQANAKPLDAE